MLDTVMVERIPPFSAMLFAAVLTILSGCTTSQPSVIEKLDELTSVTISHSRTPIIMSPDTPFDKGTARDFVQIGAIEVNRMGARRYFLWLGIWDNAHVASTNTHPQEFESILLTVEGEKIPLELLGWTEAAIGASEPVYKKLFGDAQDAYYEVTLDQINLLTAVEQVRLRTSDSAVKELTPWYRQDTAREDLVEFLRIVSP